MKYSGWFFLLVVVFATFRPEHVSAQSQASQPLNAAVSDFGTSFTFNAPPICAGCAEVELGFASSADTRSLPIVATFALGSRTDFSVLVNALQSDVTSGRRAMQFGDRFDFVMRRELFAKNGFTLTLAPRGTLFVRGTDGGRIGISLAPQYSQGRGTAVANFSFTRAVASSPMNPKNDYQGAFDYAWSLTKSGAAVFAGIFHEIPAGSPQMFSVEQGFILPFKNGQVEFQVGELNLNTKPMWGFQTRIIANFQKIFRK